jgi:hypothetical protein
MYRTLLLIALGSAILMPSASFGAEHKLVQTSIDAKQARVDYRKLLVIAITDDRSARRNFENKFVSYLRGRKVDGMTSHSLVASLSEVEDRTRILNTIAEQRVDSAITVRLVPLKETTEEEWGELWQESVRKDATVRMLIEETLPVSPVRSRKFGVEVALWDTTTGGRVWAGRSDVYKRKELESEAGNFVNMVMDELKEARLLFGGAP